VFGKLVAIMLVMALSLMTVVTFFFVGFILPGMNHSIESALSDYVRAVVATQPSQAEARRMAKQLDFDVRYEGPDGGWSTADWLPTAAEARTYTNHWAIGGTGYYVAAAPNGGTYVFHWSFRRKTIHAHQILLLATLAIMTVTILVTHLVIRRMLQPLRVLGDGVARLSAGHLDTILPAPAGDEFGALTNGFNEMVGRVREMIRARDQLLLDVSHELRSPITRMRVAVELLPEGAGRTGMVADLAEMEAMIAELLELERLRDGRGLRTERQDLAAILRDVASGFHDRAPGVRILSLPREIPIDADGEKIRTVLRNLLENAVKYSLPDSRPVEVAAACDDTTAVVTVTDDGPGVPAEDRVTIFEPFFRVNRSRTKVPAGYGLGLSICKRVIEAHGGTITLKPNTPRGCVFEVTLPVATG
jgi:signal transduction histidine kinase